MHIQAYKHAACTHVNLHACTLTCIQAWHACVGRCWRVEPKEGWRLFLQHHTGHTRNKNYLVLVAKGLVLEVTSALGIHRHKYSESVRMNMQTWRDTWISNFYQLHATYDKRCYISVFHSRIPTCILSFIYTFIHLHRHTCIHDMQIIIYIYISYSPVTVLFKTVFFNPWEGGDWS